MAQAENNERNITRKFIFFLPKIQVESTFVRQPKGLPIDFYNESWFQRLDNSQRKTMADCENLEFFLTPEDSLKPKSHPDQKISDKNHSKKYRDVVVKPYGLEEFDSEKSAEEDSEGGVSILKVQAQIVQGKKEIVFMHLENLHMKMTN
ncbi:hypothetical protein O181_057355 [Austropuccinia psidii MF-1]|uniref:Uncharacterized protein n=1 Tax=Austropuccinia psidii MF-1 TaxID=1389203 RepID=A0A9Q3EEH1_9BASI|nr:hypothetical protein [Austropuccinia psidii MF-1]